jgi:protoheme ferro-lyase
VPALRLIVTITTSRATSRRSREACANTGAARAPRERLLFSFHGIPKQTSLAGDPYYCQCLKTARLVAEGARAAEGSLGVSFQSRLGRAQWLQPYTAELLPAWAREGVREVDIISPGFAADCVETLEEIAIRYRTDFEAAGGASLRYIRRSTSDATISRSSSTLSRSSSRDGRRRTPRRQRPRRRSTNARTPRRRSTLKEFPSVIGRFPRAQPPG